MTRVQFLESFSVPAGMTPEQLQTKYKLAINTANQFYQKRKAGQTLSEQDQQTYNQAKLWYTACGTVLKELQGRGAGPIAVAASGVNGGALVGTKFNFIEHLRKRLPSTENRQFQNLLQAVKVSARIAEGDRVGVA
jgi:hypothetical protein